MRNLTSAIAKHRASFLLTAAHFVLKREPVEKHYIFHPWPAQILVQSNEFCNPIWL